MSETASTRLAAVITVDGTHYRFNAEGDPTVVVVGFRHWLAGLPVPKGTSDADALDLQTVWSGAKERSGEAAGLSGMGGLESSLSDSAMIGKG